MKKEDDALGFRGKMGLPGRQWIGECRRGRPNRSGETIGQGHRSEPTPHCSKNIGAL